MCCLFEDTGVKCQQIDMEKSLPSKESSGTCFSQQPRSHLRISRLFASYPHIMIT